jgi:uncharacterized protein (TIGR04255 family)
MTKTDELLKLDNAPLVYVLAQVVFSPILVMENFIPAIQEKLRHKGYVKYKYAPTQEIFLSKEVQFSVLKRWIFSTRNEQESIVITQNFFVLETSNYDVFDIFITKLKDVITIFQEITDVSLIERIGLRYVDLIRTKEGQTFSDYLQPGLLGISADDFGASKTTHRIEQVAITPLGQIAIRLFQSDNGAYLPPDLIDSSVVHSININPGETVAVLDIDHFSAQSKDFVVDELIESVQGLHEYIKKAFRSAVTDSALETWKAEKN